MLLLTIINHHIVLLTLGWSLISPFLSAGIKVNPYILQLPSSFQYSGSGIFSHIFPCLLFLSYIGLVCGPGGS